MTQEISEPVTKNIRFLHGKCYMFLSLVFIATAFISCIYLNKNLDHEKNQRTREAKIHTDEVENLREQKSKLTSELGVLQKALSKSKEETDHVKAACQLAEKKENAYRKQSLALGVANDRLVTWMMRRKSKEIPSLEESKSAEDAEVIVSSLKFFLKQTEEIAEFQPVRTRIMMQLAELLTFQKKIQAADQMLDSAIKAGSKRVIEEPGYSYRIARIRCACIIQALDQGKKELVKPMREKLLTYLNKSNKINKLETQRLQSLLHLVNGRMIQEENPAKALENFTKAIKLLEGMNEALRENVRVRSDLARVSLEAASLAESLNHLNKASQLRENAAKLLEKLLDKHSELRLPKVQLAQIYIMNATSDVRIGENTRGKAKLVKAEKLLKGLPQNDLSPQGVVMQIAAAKSLRAVLLRDAGKSSSAITIINEAINLVKKVIAQQAKTPLANNEPLYRLSVLHWQLAGVLGDSGNHSAELKKGAEAASLMEELLKRNGGKHDLTVRRALAYLYGDLGHTSALKKNHAGAAKYFDKAALIWQSLITKYGKYEEYTDGFKWSKSRYKEQKAFH